MAQAQGHALAHLLETGRPGCVLPGCLPGRNEAAAVTARKREDCTRHSATGRGIPCFQRTHCPVTQNYTYPEHTPCCLLSCSPSALRCPPFSGTLSHGVIAPAGCSGWPPGACLPAPDSPGAADPTEREAAGRAAQTDGPAAGTVYRLCLCADRIGNRQLSCQPFPCSRGGGTLQRRLAAC